MTALRSFLSKGSIQAVVACALVGTACYLAISDRIDGPTFLTIAILPVAYLFRSSTPTP